VLRVKPNTGNPTVYEFSKPAAVSAVSDYNYAAVSPADSLTGGAGAQTITLSPCPLGILNGSTWAPVTITGSSGTAEALTPSGGTCTSGAASGTIIVSPANSYNPGYTVTSATGGIQEAINALGANGGAITLACGATHTLSAGVVSTTNLTVSGCGPSSTIAVAGNFTPSAAWTAAGGGSLILENVALDGNRNNNPAQTSAGIFFTGAGRFLLRHSLVKNWNANGAVLVSDASGPAEITGNVFQNNATHNVYLKSTSFANTEHRVTDNVMIGSIIAIASCSNTTPIVCTLSSPRPLYGGQYLTVRGASAAAVNGQWAITPIGPGPTYSSFSLGGSTASGASTGGTYTEGGMAVEAVNQGHIAVNGNSSFGGSSESFNLYASSHSTLCGNNSYYSGDGGITLNQGSSYNTICENNITSSWFEGIDVVDASVGTTGNDFEDNSVSNVANGLAGRGGGMIIIGAQVTNTLIRGGELTFNPEYGIRQVSNVSGTVIENVVLTGNTLGPHLADGSVTSTRIEDLSGNFAWSDISSGSWANGSKVLVSDANAACSGGSGTGAECSRINGLWIPSAVPVAKLVNFISPEIGAANAGGYVAF
jgi:hypothetical protein